MKAILDFEAVEDEFRAQSIREHSQQFDRAIFKERFADFVRFALDRDGAEKFTRLSRTA